MLRREHDAEDAFQATFLVLARSARSVRRRTSVRSWLYGVALRVALRARMRGARWPSSLHSEPAATSDLEQKLNRADLTAALDEEIGRLPKRYRLPLVHCYLLGQTNDEAARQLGWPRGTVATRLARARERLRPRLVRRGLSPTATLPAMPFLGPIPACSLPASGPASTLAQGVLTTMFLVKCKTAALVVLTAGALATVAAFAQELGKAEKEPAKAAAIAPLPAEKKGDKPPEARAKQMKDLLTARQSAALDWFKTRHAEFLAGRGTLSGLLDCTQAVVKADLALSETRENRIAVRAAHLDRLKEILDVNKRRYDAGRVGIGDIKQVEYCTLDAEIELEREKGR